MAAVMPAYFTREYVRVVQMALNEKTKGNLPITGIFTKEWNLLLMKYQLEEDVLPTGKYDEATQKCMEDFTGYKYLQEEDYEKAASEMGCTLNAVKAMVMAMRVPGFINNGKCRINFHRLKFYDYLATQRSPEEMDALSAKHELLGGTVPTGYFADTYEYDRFCAAIQIDSYHAMISTSWGMFRIGGANYRICGYSTPAAFAMDMQRSERFHLQALVKLLKKLPQTTQALKELDWWTFARFYFSGSMNEGDFCKRAKQIHDELPKPRKVKEEVVEAPVRTKVPVLGQ